MKKAFYIALKEVKDFIYDKGDLLFSLVLPVLIFGLMYGAFGGQNLFNGTAYIVNADENGRYSQQLLDELGSYSGLKIELLPADEADARLGRSNIYLAIFIPADFTEKLTAGETAQIVFKQRGNGSTEGQITAGLVQGAADKISQQVLLEHYLRQDLPGVDESQINSALAGVLAQEQIEPAVKVVEDTLGGENDPISQFLPGIMTMFVLFAVNLTAQSLVDERARGTLERLMATRLKVSELFAGKFLAYTARGFIQTIILMALAYAVFGLFTPLTFLQAAVLALVFSAACSTLGIIIGSVSRTRNQATWIAVFFTMLMVMLAGTFMPVTEGTLLGTLSKFSINTC
jgi:ABC-2 type transport system permease protein